MAIALNGSVYTQNQSANVTSLTVTGVTVASSLNNSLLVVFYAGYSKRLTSATWNGEAMTVVNCSPNFFYESYAYIINPASGNNDLVLTPEGSTGMGIAVQVFTGINQTTPVPQYVSNYAEPPTSITNTLTTGADNAWLVQTCMSYAGGAATFGAGQTERWNVAMDYRFSGSYKNAGVAGEKTMTVSKESYAAPFTIELKAFVSAFDVQRQNIIDGLTSAQSETLGWNNEVRDKIPVTDVVRTSDTIVTVTLSSETGYNITANETITATIPATAVTLAGAIVASPTFQVDYNRPVKKVMGIEI